MTTDTTASYFIPLEENGVSPHFTDMSEIPSKGFNVLVRAKRDGQWWVLKGLKPQFREDVLYQELLHKEYDLLSRLRHGDVVGVEGLEHVEGYGECIVMEWIDGENLDQWLKSPHDKAEKLRVFGELLDATEYVHREQIVHRDLKPGNVMVTRNGQHVKLIDFGLADADNYAVLKQPAGTDGYTAPEQLAGCAPDVRNDIYSLGVILGKMQLGWSARRVAARCRKEMDERFADVAALRDALRSTRRHFRLACWAIVAFLFSLLGFFSYQKLYEPQQTYDIVADFKVGYLRYQSWGGGFVTVQGTDDVDSCVEIPATVVCQGISYEVSEITIEAFKNHRNLKRVVFPHAELHFMSGAFMGCTHLKELYFRSKTPPLIGNKIWKTSMEQVFDADAFDRLVLYVPKGCLSAYRQSPWGIFKNIREYA